MGVVIEFKDDTRVVLDVPDGVDPVTAAIEHCQEHGCLEEIFAVIPVRSENQEGEAE